MENGAVQDHCVTPRDAPAEARFVEHAVNRFAVLVHPVAADVVDDRRVAELSFHWAADDGPGGPGNRCPVDDVVLLRDPCLAVPVDVSEVLQETHRPPVVEPFALRPDGKASPPGGRVAGVELPVGGNEKAGDEADDGGDESDGQSRPLLEVQHGSDLRGVTAAPRPRDRTAVSRFRGASSIEWVACRSCTRMR